ncbi:MAG: PEP-CTERM sorting domain-containing protein [Acidobacteriia bacterium]|nr:PEP-CTERM sorting domain-containing protein [Terriglobia bacterium]
MLASFAIPKAAVACFSAAIFFLTAPVSQASLLLEPAVDILVASQPVTAPENLIPPLPGQSVWRYSQKIDTPEYSLEVEAAVDPDPFLTYGFSVMNLSNQPLDVFKHYSIQLDGGPWNAVTATLSIASVGGQSGFFISPAQDGVVRQASVDAKDRQVGVGGDCSSARAGAVACYSVSTSQSVAVQSDSTLDVYVHFILAGLGSAATVNGRVEILDLTPAPEPGTLFLAGLALLSVALLRRSI